MKKFIDFWSVPHFLTGAVTALATSAFSWDPGIMFLVTLVLAILWEFFERGIKIGEEIKNVISDILLPLVAFPATYVFAQQAIDTSERRIALFVVVLIVYAYICTIAWRARAERDRDFMNN